MDVKCIFIYNPYSGKGKICKQEDYITQELKKKFDDVIVCPTQYAGHAYELAINACNKYDCIVIGGGDGTLNEVINAVARQDCCPIIGYIPAGTVNDCARTLGISKKIKKAVNAIIDGVEKKCDLLKVNEHYGIYVCCTGIFTNASYLTNQASKNKIGKIAYFFHGIKSLFKQKPVHITAVSQNMHYQDNTALMLLLNSKSVAGFNVNPIAKIDDGILDVLFVRNKNSKKITLGAMLSVCRVFLFGISNIKNNKRFLKTQVNQIEIKCDDSIPINIDGENPINGGFNLSVKTKKIKILVPKEK